MSVRVRFAPSPTGYLHVGGLRTALYNFLFAKHHGGKNILRIEDTDRTRFVENSQQNLIDNLKWAGIEFDEGPDMGGEFGPYIQSERFDLYRQHAQMLLDNGTAYYAFDTAEELDAMRERQQKAGIAPKYDRTIMKNQFTLGEDETKARIESGEPVVVRMKVPIREEIRFTDIIRGEVIVNSKDVDDQILLKSDGFPTYHLANVVDDHLMQITHVIRGEEWLPSAPKHVLLYKSFGWEHPSFAHLPLLLNDNKSKLSKRHGDVAVEDFREKGYLKDAFVNFIALLGWNPSSDREIFSMQELVDSFNLEKVNKSGAIFDRRKLEWMNGQYLRQTDVAELAIPILPKVKAAGYEASDEYVAKVINLLKERISFAGDIIQFGDYMFQKPTIDEAYKAKAWKADTLDNISELITRFKNVGSNDWNHENLHNIVNEFLTEKNAKFGVVMNPFRLMITGKPVGAGLTETMELLGKDECISRIDTFLTNL